jgi:hypothetical protein
MHVSPEAKGSGTRAKMVSELSASVRKPQPRRIGESFESMKYLYPIGMCCESFGKLNLRSSLRHFKEEIESEVGTRIRMASSG